MEPRTLEEIQEAALTGGFPFVRWAYQESSSGSDEYEVVPESTD